jgi:hypothetical protein
MERMKRSTRALPWIVLSSAVIGRESLVQDHDPDQFFDRDHFSE